VQRMVNQISLRDRRTRYDLPDFPVSFSGIARRSAPSTSLFALFTPLLLVWPALINRYPLVAFLSCRQS